MKDLTNNEKADYLSKGGRCCPHCGDDELSGGMVNVEEDRAYQDITCTSCKRRWTDIHQLIDIRLID